jgi:hypothetical protein
MEATNQLKFVTDREASQITGLAVQTLRNYRMMRKGPAYSKVGSSIRYSVDDLKNFMSKHRVVPSMEE